MADTSKSTPAAKKTSAFAARDHDDKVAAAKATPAAKSTPAKAAPAKAAKATARAGRDTPQAEGEQQYVAVQPDTGPDPVEQAELTARGRSEVRRDADTTEERRRAAGVCVVSDGKPHVGRALPGKDICSAHEIHYYPDGTPRRKVHAAAQKAAEKPDGGHLVDERA